MRQTGFLVMDMKELFKEIDLRITSCSSTTPDILAQELAVKVQIIERAVRETVGISYREYLESKKLAHILGALEERRNNSIGQAYGNQRAEPRMTVPGATVSYRLRGRGIRRSDFSGPYPLFDLSQAGIAFFSDHPLKPGRELSLLIESAKLTGTLRLGGRVVYAVAENNTNYPYRLGARFRPFEAKRGSNSPESLELLTQLMSAAARYEFPNHDQGLT